MLRLLFLMVLSLFSFAVFGQDVPAEPSALIKFGDKYWVYIGAAYAAWEFMVGESARFKSNSTIAMAYNFVKSIFGK